jgi:hypothetical protein
VCTVTAVLVVLTGPGAATPAAAAGLSIGADSTVQLGDALLALGCDDLLIKPTATLQAQASTISLAGNWDNRGTFGAGTGTVLFEDGCVPNLSSIAGSTTFFDLRITTSTGKTVRFEAGVTQKILDGLTLMGAPGNLLVIRSSIPGQQAFLDLAPAASQLIDYVDVADNGATGQDLAPGAHSIDSGNTTGWLFVTPTATATDTPTDTPTPTPTATPSSTATRTVTVTPTRTGVPDRGSCMASEECQSHFCVNGICRPVIRPAPAVSGIGLAGLVLLLLAVARTALRRGSRESGASR